MKISMASLYRKNVGGIDRWIRLAAGVLLAAVGLVPLGGLHGDLDGIAVLLVGGAGVLSSVLGRCPLYVPFGISTAGGCTGGEPGDRATAGERDRAS